MLQDPKTNEHRAGRKRPKPGAARAHEDGGRRGIWERFSSLTRREREVMELVIAAKKTREIAVELGVSKRTIEHHRTQIMRKLDTGSVVELVTTAMRHGLCGKSRARAPSDSSERGSADI